MTSGNWKYLLKIPGLIQNKTEEKHEQILFLATGNTVHIISSMIPIFIMPIAVLDGIHILSEFFDRYQETRDRRKNHPPCVGHLIHAHVVHFPHHRSCLCFPGPYAHSPGPGFWFVHFIGRQVSGYSCGVGTTGT